MGAVTSLVRYTVDSLQNLVSSLGVEGRDKNTSTRYVFTPLDQVQIENAFRGDWVARKGICIPADDATREWRQWQATDAQVEAIEAEEQRLGLQGKTKWANTLARLYGGAGIMVGIRGDDAIDQPLNVEAVKGDGIEFLHVVSRHEVSAGRVEDDVRSPTYGLPSTYDVTGPNGRRVTLHASRLIRFGGNDLPRRGIDAANDGWGDSVLQVLDDAVKNCGLCAGGIAQLVHESKVDVIKIPNLMANVGSKEFRDRVLERAKLANVGKSIFNSLLMDKDEEWDRIKQDFAGLPDIYKLYLLVACAAWDIPATRFMSQSALGLNATGEGDLRNYYDNVGSTQKNELAPTLAPLDEMVIRSALNGNRPDEVHYIWRPLWQMDPMQRAKVGLDQAQAFQIDAANGVVPIEVLRKGRFNQLVEGGTYPGIEAAMDEHQAELDEESAEVKAQFGAGGEEVQKQALNGTQISSLMEIVTAVGEEKLPAETAKALMKASFPSLDPKEVDAIVDPMESFEPKPDPVPVIPGPGARPGGGQPGDDIRRKRAANDKFVAEDAEPRTLYVRRDVINGAEIRAWMKAQGFESMVPLDQLHVTICYSRTPVYWMKMGEPYSYGDTKADRAKGQIVIAEGGPRIVEPLGPNGAVVLMFASSEISWRHESMKHNGASFDWDSFQPHITLTYDKGEIDLAAVEPYRGKIVLGPEIFEEAVDSDSYRNTFKEIRP